MDHHDHDPILSPSSLKQKLKLSLPLSSCFSKSRDHPPRLTRCSSGHVPDCKLKYRNFLSRNFGGGGTPKHARRHSSTDFKHARRHSSTDFSYDAMSYALNFDEGGDDRDDDESPLRSFTARLPRSPDREFNSAL